MLKYALYKADYKIFFGIKYDFKNNQDCEITIYNKSFPNGKQAKSAEKMFCLNYIINNDPNLSFVEEDEFMRSFCDEHL